MQAAISSRTYKQIGANTVEYGLVMALIVGLMLGAAQLMGSNIQGFFVQASQCVLNLLNGDIACSADVESFNQDHQNIASMNQNAELVSINSQSIDGGVIFDEVAAQPLTCDAAEQLGGISALKIISENWELVDGMDGDVDGAATDGNLQAIIDSQQAPENLSQAAKYLLDNPRLFEMMEIMNDSDTLINNTGGYSQVDGVFNQQDIDIFLEGQENLQVIYENHELFDVANKGGDGDGEIWENDFKSIRDKKNENGEYIYSQELRDAAEFFLENDRMYEAVDTAIPHGDLPEVGLTSGNYSAPDGHISIRDMQLALIESQAFSDDPAAARDFILSGGADIAQTNISDENSISDEGMRALVSSALQDTNNMTDVIELISAMPETNGGVRNELITGVYADLGLKMDQMLGNESGANWAIWGVPASDNVGDVIRNEPTIEIAFTNNGATGGQRTLMAEGNLLLFNELAPHINNFYEEFNNDNSFDQQKFSEFAQGFNSEQQELAQGFESYYRAMVSDDPREKQELTLLGNYHLVLHEQTLVDETLDRVLTDLPLYADIFNKVSGNTGSDRANAAIKVEYPGRSSSVENNVPVHDPDVSAYMNFVADLSGIENINIIEILENAHEADGADSPGPESLDSTYADDWHEIDERMYYIYQDWRLHHTDNGLFEMAESSQLENLGC